MILPYDATPKPDGIFGKDSIELKPNKQKKLEIDLYGDLAGILALAGKKDRPLDQKRPVCSAG
jgi:hypothetical protein